METIISEFAKHEKVDLRLFIPLPVCVGVFFLFFKVAPLCLLVIVFGVLTGVDHVHQISAPTPTVALSWKLR